MTLAAAKAVVFHQIRQMFLYTFYLGMFQCVIFHYGLSPTWSALAFVFLLSVSIYEDRRIIEQENMPDSVMVVRIWACNFPLILVNCILYCLDRFNLMHIEAEPGPRIAGRPSRMIVVAAESGYGLLDDIFIMLSYYLYYFSGVAMYRSLINQYRFVVNLAAENMGWTPNVEDTPSDFRDGDQR